MVVPDVGLAISGKESELGRPKKGAERLTCRGLADR